MRKNDGTRGAKNGVSIETALAQCGDQLQRQLEDGRDGSTLRTEDGRDGSTLRAEDGRDGSTLRAEDGRDGRDGSALRASVRSVASIARRDALPPERVLVLLKEMVARVPAVGRKPLNERTAVTAQLVQMAIAAYYDAERFGSDGDGRSADADRRAME